MRMAMVLQMAAMIVLVMLPTGAASYEEVEDRVEIFSIDDRFVALINGRSHFSENYRSGEEVLWQGAKGEVGVFLTNERLLAVSVKSGRWNTLYLKINEKKKTPEMLFAAHLVIMLTDERIVAFGTDTGGFFHTRLPIDESVIEKAAEGRVAAAVTRNRAYGFSSYRRGAAEIRFRRQETIVSLKTTYNKVTLQTTERLIALEAEDAVWHQFDLK
jgi:hypothetical protein